MEPDPLPWVFIFVSFLFIGFIVAIEVSLAMVERTDLTNLHKQFRRRTVSARWLLNHVDEFLILSAMVKSLSLMLLGIGLWQGLYLIFSTPTVLLILTTLSLFAVFLQMSVKNFVRHQSVQVVLRSAPLVRSLIYVSWPLLQLLRK